MTKPSHKVSVEIILILKKKNVSFFFVSIGPKKQTSEKPSMPPIIEDVIESTGPTGMMNLRTVFRELITAHR